MFLHLSPEQRELQKQVQTLVAERIAPRAAEIDARDEFPQESYQAFKETGLLKLSLPREYGGIRADATTLCLVIEEISKSSPASALLVFPTQAVIRTIREVGTEEQKQRFFSDMSAGDKLAAFCLTEPNFGSDAGSLQTRANWKMVPMWLTDPRSTLPKALTPIFTWSLSGPDPGNGQPASVPSLSRAIRRDYLSGRMNAKWDWGDRSLRR